MSLPIKVDKKAKLIAQHAQLVNAIARRSIMLRRLERELDEAIEALATVQAQLEAESATIN